MRSIVLIAHNMRSCHNVGSLLRTAEGLGIDEVWLTGYTPYPLQKNDTRMPHLSNKIHTQIHKTSLGAEMSISWKQSDNVMKVINDLREKGYTIIGLEQAKSSIKLPDYHPPEKIVVILGNEIDGLAQAIIKQCSTLIEIPVFGKKESFNVVQAAAMALYHCKFFKT